MRPSTLALKQYITVSREENPREFKRQYDCLLYHHKAGNLQEFLERATDGILPIRAYNRSSEHNKRPKIRRIFRPRAAKPLPLAVIRWKQFCGLI